MKALIFALTLSSFAQAETCETLLSQDKLAQPEVIYTIENVDRHLHSLRLADEVVTDLNEADPRFAARLMRAVLHGFVGAHSGSGVVRLKDIHKDLVEVKVIGTDVRAIGCFRNGHLYLKRLIKKRNEGKGGSLAKKFASFCTEN